MARDLIPPSLPAGRPAPDGTPNLVELPPEPERAPARPALREPVGPSPHRKRFGFLLGALAGVLIAAAAAGGVVVAGGESTEVADGGLAPNWSAWQPTDRSPAGPVEIAKEISKGYRDANDNPLVVVEATPIEQRVAVRGASGATDLMDNTPGITYTMDGLGR